MPDSLEKPMGGMGEQCRQLINVFDKNYFFDIVGSNENCKTKGKNFEFTPIDYSFSTTSNEHSLLTTLMCQASFLKEAVLLSKPDLVHAFDWSSFIAGYYAARHFKVPLVVTLQLSMQKLFEHIIPSMDEGNMALFNQTGAIEISGMLHADRIIQVSENYAKKFPSIFDSKTSIIPNGINLSEWIKKSDFKFPGNRKIKVVYLGRFDEMKNVQTLLQLDLPKEIDLCFIGTRKGGSVEIYSKVAGQLPEGFHYLGPKYGQEKIDALMSADAVIMPSLHEPFGIVALEALAAKTILLSSFMDGLGDFLTEDSAINCGVTKQSIEAALSRLITMTDEEKEARKQKGMDICNRYTWDIQAQKLKGVYDYFINASKTV